MNINNKQFRYFSTFSGIGGFELGIQKAHESLCDVDGSEDRRIKEDKEGNQRPRLLASQGKDAHTQERPTRKRSADFPDERPLCVGYSEIDKYAVQIYQKHFDHKQYGDITKIKTEELPDFDMLVGGFPCQSFSIAGKRGGFNDTRGTMFFELARILRDKRPQLFLFENVKGLLSHDEGRTFATIITTLDELGYDLQWQVLNSKNHGVPQNRERVFIVGNLRGNSRPQVFPFTNDGGSAHELSGHNANTLRGSEGSGSHTNFIANTLTRRYEGAQAVGTYIGEGELNAQEIIQVNKPTHSNERVYDSEGISPTLNTMQGGNRQPFVLNTERIRRLTPTECERLQGFPDGWTEGVSDTQRYKTLGNAVTVNVIQAVMERIFIDL